MKKTDNTAIQGRKRRLINPFFYLLLTAAGFFFTACQKDGLDKPAVESVTAASSKMNSDAIFINNYQGLSFTTAWELQQARAATSKYQNINNAIADGYMDIAVDVQNMGHHYLNMSLLDGTFDIKHPEILVYNKDDNGNQQLVAVEYAIPIDQPRPEGFTGSNDVWDHNDGFGLWLLHAWVWYNNPDGVFMPFNPLVQLH